MKAWFLLSMVQNLNEGLKIGESLKLFLIMLIAGAVIALLYDFFRGARKATKKAYREIAFMVHIEDLIFVLASFVIFVLSAVIFNDGEIRGYMILGLIAGIMLYYAVVSPISNKLFFWVLYILIKVFSFPVKVIVRFIRFIVEAILLSRSKPSEESEAG